MHGKSVPQDYVEAVKWFEKGAQRGHANSLCNLAVCYASAWGVLCDIDHAIDLFVLAFRGGSKESATNLGYLYQGRDLTQAVHWHTEALRAGALASLHPLMDILVKSNSSQHLQKHGFMAELTAFGAEHGDAKCRESLQTSNTSSVLRDSYSYLYGSKADGITRDKRVAHILFRNYMDLCRQNGAQFELVVGEFRTILKNDLGFATVSEQLRNVCEVWYRGHKQQPIPEELQLYILDFLFQNEQNVVYEGSFGKYILQ
jgi:hypothetical protein